MSQFSQSGCVAEAHLQPSIDSKCWPDLPPVKRSDSNYLADCRHQMTDVLTTPPPTKSGLGEDNMQSPFVQNQLLGGWRVWR